MPNYSVSEKDMLKTMIAISESDQKNEIAALLKVSDFVYDPRYDFSGIVYNQKKLYGIIKVPVTERKFAENSKDYFSAISMQIYNDDDYYRYLGISSIGIKAIHTEEIDFDEKTVFLEKDSTYSNFASFVINNKRLDEIQKNYLFEACDCANNKDTLAASVMLGASCELMLIRLTEAYKIYLDNHASQTEADAFNKRVVNARCANDRLTEFLKRAESKAEVLKKYGFDNIPLMFSFFNVIRKTRNDSGHPTGIKISEQEMKMIMTEYTAVMDKLLDAIEGLPKD